MLERVFDQPCLILQITECLPHDGESECRLKSHVHIEVCNGSDENTALNQAAQHQGKAGFHTFDRRLEDALLVDVRQSVQEVIIRNADIVEQYKAIIDAGQALFRTAVANRDPCQGHVRLLATQRDNECMGPVVLATHK